MRDKVAAFLGNPNEPEYAKAVLKWQFDLNGHFFKHLWNAIIRADEHNLAKLALGFPVEVEGYRLWSRGTLAHELREKGVMD